MNKYSSMTSKRLKEVYDTNRSMLKNKAARKLGLHKEAQKELILITKEMEKRK